MLWHQTLCCRATWHGPVLTFPRRLIKHGAVPLGTSKGAGIPFPGFPSTRALFQAGPGVQSATPIGSGATWEGKLSDQVLYDSSLAFLTSPHPLPLSRISSSEGGRGRSPGRAWMPRVGSDQCYTPPSAHPLALSGPI